VRPSRGVVALIATVLVGIVAAVFAAPVVWVEIDGGEPPPASDVPHLPDGVTIARDETMCGSGGCWRELTVRGPRGRSPTERAASLGWPEETCAARSFLDRRRVCSGVTVAPDGGVRLYLVYDRRLDL